MIVTSDVLAMLAEFVGEAKVLANDGEHPLVGQQRGGDKDSGSNFLVLLLFFIIGI